MSFYVYQLIDPRTSEPFYVGKGKDNRMYCHVQEAKRGVYSQKCKLIRELLEAGLEIEYRVISKHRKEQDAYDEEARIIDEIGLHRLTNVMPGGGGIPERKERPHQLCWGVDKKALVGLAAFFRQYASGNDVCLAGVSLYKLAVQSLASLIKDYGIEKVGQELARYKVDLNMKAQQ